MAMRTIRVRVHAGRLEPLEELSLPEGAEVSMRFEEPVRRRSPQTIVAAMDRWPELAPDLFDELERAIEAGKLPVRSEGVFDGRKD